MLFAYVEGNPIKEEAPNTAFVTLLDRWLNELQSSNFASTGDHPFCHTFWEWTGPYGF